MPHALEIAGMVCPNNVFLAPMAGYTNLPFRQMCEELGAGLTFTEMVSAKGLHYGSEETKLLLLHGTSSLVAEGSVCPPPASGVERRTMLNSPVGCERAAIGALASATGVAAVPAAATGVGEGVRPQPIAATGVGEGVRPQPIAAQIFGSDPEIMREACESEALKDFDLIDINMGCPMPKIVKNGEGSALMENFSLAEKVISSCAKSGKRISVKFRVGISEDTKCAAEFARLCEGAGACLITVHGRTREKIYAGPCDFDEIAAAKNAVNIPVIANGGVWNAKDMQKTLDRTGADGVMVARAALYRPAVFAELTGREEPPLLPLFLKELEETERLYGERFALVFMRKMAAFYLKGKRGGARGKQRLFAAQTLAEVASLACELLSFE